MSTKKSTTQKPNIHPRPPPARPLVIRDGICFYCHQFATASEYCYGCQTYVCSKCDVPPFLYCLISGKKHPQENHLLRLMQLPSREALERMDELNIPQLEFSVNLGPRKRVAS